MYLFIALFTAAVLLGMVLRKATPQPQSIRISPAQWPERRDQGIFVNTVEFAPSRSRLGIRFRPAETGDKIAGATASGHVRTVVQKL